jgi:hypothetical protein
LAKVFYLTMAGPRRAQRGKGNEPAIQRLAMLSWMGGYFVAGRAARDPDGPPMESV